MALDILHDNWGPYTHTEVENALKAYLTVLENRINQAIQSGGVGMADLSAEVQALLYKANTALQPESIAAWAKAQNKPGYTVSEITGVEGFQNLLAKLQDMDQKIQAAAASGGVDPDDEMSSTSENMVQNKVIKAYVDQAVQTVQNALNALMNGTNVTDAIDTFNEIVTFLNGIDTDDPTLFNQLKSLSDAITAFNTALSGKVDKTTTVNGKALSGNVTIGMSDIQGLLEALANAGGESVVINSDGANIVDSHTNPSILVAPSARQMYMAYQNINTLFTKVNDLYDKLAGIAFKDGKPANWKENANWLTPAIPTHTITIGMMSNVSASMNGTAISGSTSASEGKVTILLTPSGNNYMGNISVKDASNNDVAFTQTDVTGGTEITFILSGNVTISASASSGIQVNVSGTGITSYTTGVQPNTAAQLTIALPEHHTWDSVTVSYGGTDITSQCTISQANNADKVITLPNNLSDMSKSISIVANTVEDAHVMLSVSGSGYTISDGTKTYSNGDKVYNTAQVTLSIAPASGKKFTTLPSSDKGSMTNNGAYAASSLDIGTSVSGTVAISAETADLTNYSVGFQSIANFSVAYTDLSGNAIAAENNVATVAENSGVKIRITPAPDHTLTIGGMTMGDSSVTPSVTTDNGVTVITIEHVTGAVVVSAEANEAGAVEVTTTAKKATVTDNGAKQGGTLVLTIKPSSGYGFKAAEDANDVNRGVILIKDGNNNVIVDTVNGIGLDKVTYGAITNGNLSLNKYWSTPTASNTIITISNAPASVTVNVSSALMFKENGYVDYAEKKMVRPWSYHLARYYGELPCGACANVQNEGNMVSTSKISWNNPNLAQVIYMYSRTACMISYDNSDAKVEHFNANAGLKVISASANANYLNIVKWRMLFCAGIVSNGKRYLESSYLYHHPSGDTANDGDKNVIFDGADKSSWIFIPDTSSPKVVFDGIPEGIVPKRVEAADNYTQSCKKIDGYYTEWGDPNGSITITMTGVSNVTCSDSNVTVTESNGTFSIVVSNLATGEVRNVNLNVTV